MPAFQAVVFGSCKKSFWRPCLKWLDFCDLRFLFVVVSKVALTSLSLFSSDSKLPQEKYSQTQSACDRLSKVLEACQRIMYDHVCMNFAKQNFEVLFGRICYIYFLLCHHLNILEVGGVDVGEEL